MIKGECFDHAWDCHRSQDPAAVPAQLDDACHRLEGEINITRQILGWTIEAAPTVVDKEILSSFDQRLQSFARAVFAIASRGSPDAEYGGSAFPPPQHHPFAKAVEALRQEISIAKHERRVAEAAALSPDDRQTLEQQGTVFDDLINAADAMVTG